MFSQDQNDMEILKDEEFLYASLKRKHVKVLRNSMSIEVTVEVGFVCSFTENYIKINDSYFLRNENKFVIKSI